MDQKQQQGTEHTDEAPTHHDNCDDILEETQTGQSQDDRPSQNKRPNQIQNTKETKKAKKANNNEAPTQNPRPKIPPIPEPEQNEAHQHTPILTTATKQATPPKNTAETSDF